MNSFGVIIELVNKKHQKLIKEKNQQINQQIKLYIIHKDIYNYEICKVCKVCKVFELINLQGCKDPFSSP
jgi:hypothetical protein